MSQCFLNVVTMKTDNASMFWDNGLKCSCIGYENEENVLVCLRIIIELHKQFRPAHSQEITQFLQFVKSIYKELPNHLNKIFEPRAPIKVCNFIIDIFYYIGKVVKFFQQIKPIEFSILGKLQIGLRIVLAFFLSPSTSIL